MPRHKITYERLFTLIEQGYGQGFGEDYLPWIHINRNNTSATSTQVTGCLPPYKRRRSFLSQNEWYVALVLAWIGFDIREQYPLWSWDHDHPLAGIDSNYDSSLKRSSGVLDLCEDAGIKHGNFIGTKIPYIWTGDFMLNDFDNYKNTILFSVKPSEDKRFKNPDPLDRQLEKLEIERRYTEELDMKYFFGGKDDFDEIFLQNLNWLSSSAVLPKSDNRNGVLQSFLAGFSHKVNDSCIEEWISWMVCRGANHLEANFVFQHILWNQLVDVDISQPIVNHREFRKGGIAYRNTIKTFIAEGELL